MAPAGPTLTGPTAADAPPEVPPPDASDQDSRSNADRSTARQIRGSSLLLFGRLLSLGTNFAVQVLIVRYLAKAEYGMFAYGLSVVSLGAIIVTLGTDRSVSRFLPIFEERKQPEAILGTVLFVGGIIATLGLSLIVLVVGLQGLVSDTLVDPRAGPLLAILILLAPLQALDDMLMNAFAVFASPRTIFFRRYVLNPALRLAVVGLLIATGQGAEFLAAGYVAVGAIGVGVYVVLFWRLLRRLGILPKTGRPVISIPAREILLFSLPLLSTDLIYILLNSMDVLVLGAVTDAETVASYRVIQPAAALNLIVLQSFTMLFTPAAARLFARDDHGAIRELYWRTAAWVAVASFPIFALTFALAEPLTVFLFEERYRESGIFLAIIAVGRYFDAALGFNGMTVRVFGYIKAIVVVNLIAAGLNLVLLLVLIPQFGALGAALSTGLTLVVYNSLKQYALYRTVGITLFDRRYVPVYATIVVSAAALFLIDLIIDPPLIVGMVLVGITSILVLVIGRSHLRLNETFPELARLPIIRSIMR